MKKSWMNSVILTGMALLLMLAPLWLTPLYELIFGRPGIKISRPACFWKPANHMHPLCNFSRFVQAQ